MQTFSIALPDEAVSAIDAAAAAAGISRAEWIRQVCTRTIPGGEPGVPAEHLGTLVETIGTLQRTRANMEMVIADRDRIAAKVAVLEEQIRDASAAHTRGREDVAAIEAERNRLTGEVDQARAAAADAERLRADLAIRDQFLAERADEITWLRGQVALLDEKLVPLALPEKAGAGGPEAAVIAARPEGERSGTARGREEGTGRGRRS